MTPEPDTNGAEYKAFSWAFIYASDWCDGLDPWKQMEIREAWFKMQEEKEALDKPNG